MPTEADKVIADLAAAERATTAAAKQETGSNLSVLRSIDARLSRIETILIVWSVVAVVGIIAYFLF